MHVVVLMGGWSHEREVSVKSGRACAQALERQGYEVTQLDVTRDVYDALKALKPDVALNALHGPVGEDGKIQGLLEFLGIPYTHSGVLASALAMDKVRAKEAMKAVNIPVPEGVVARRQQVAERHVLPVPYVVKPIAEGSSFGVAIVQGDDANPPAVYGSSCWRHGEYLLVERYVAGLELTCGVIGDRPLDVIEIQPASSHICDYEPSTGRFYDYNAKYAKGGSVHRLPADIDGGIYERIRQWSLEAHRALGCRGVTRTDFRYDNRPSGTGEIVALEINTQPGMTETSLLPEMAAFAGIEFDRLVAWMVEDASLCR